VIINRALEIKTQGNTDIINITPDIERSLAEAGISEGTVTIFSMHTTCAVTIIEYEPGLIADFKSVWERLVPKDIQYEHNKRWNDGNGYAHVRASMLGFSVTIPFTDRKMMLGTWQQVVLVDFDNRPRDRHIIFQFSGE
jgi:secondary thiamine-phosphate synthase enzyme